MPHRTDRDALIVFAKVPTPGTVKTRLTPVLAEQEAALLYEAFLRDALSQYHDLEADVRLYLSPSKQPLPADLMPGGVTLWEQRGEGLGARMRNAFLETFAAGYERLVIIGTDHPTLPTAFIEQAFHSLSAPLSICIGPSDDGGYYLLGMNDFYPIVFEDMQYSHADVLNQTLERASRAQAHLTVLPPWYDVDTPEALQRLVREIDATAAQAPHTRLALTTLGYLQER